MIGDILKKFEQKCIEKQMENKDPLPDFRVGDTLKVHINLDINVTVDTSKKTTGKKSSAGRRQVFEGICIAIRKKSSRTNFTVRKISNGIDIEKTFLVYSPVLHKLEVMKTGRVRRAKLYYLRDKIGKIRIPERKPKKTS